MNNPILFDCKSRADYFYSAKGGIHLSHPLLNFLIQLKKNGVDIHRWFNEINQSDSFHIDELGDTSTGTIAYYYKKFCLLENNGFFDSVDIKKKISGRLNPTSLNALIANISQVTFEVTDACNLNCMYCGYGKLYGNYDKRENKRLSIYAAKTLLLFLQIQWNSSLNRSHSKRIHISFYGGEPLLNVPFIEEIIRFTKNLHLPHHNFSYGITTNGLLLDKHMDFLAENNFQLSISLDGNEDNNGHRFLHNGKPSFAIIFKNILALKKRHPEYFKKLVFFNSVLHNKNSVSSINAFFKTHIGKMPDINEINAVGIRPEMREEFLKTHRNLVESLYEAEDYSLYEKNNFIQNPNTREALTTIFQYSTNVYHEYSHLTRPVGKKPTIPTATCLPFSRSIFITVNGKILPCERVGQEVALGYVDDNEVKLDIPQLVKKYNAYYDKMSKHCNHCYNSKTCSQCFFQLADLEEPSPSCNGFMNEKEFSRYLSARVSYLEDNPDILKKAIRNIKVS